MKVVWGALAVVGHMVLGAWWAWPTVQAIERDQQRLLEFQLASQNLQDRLAGLRPLEIQLGEAFDGIRAAQSLSKEERFHRLAAALTEWSDHAETEITAIRSLENASGRLEVEVDVKGPSRAVLKLLGMVDQAAPPIVAGHVHLQRVAASVVGSMRLTALPSARFTSPTETRETGWRVDPFRKDP